MRFVHDYSCWSWRRKCFCAHNTSCGLCIEWSLPEFCSRYERTRWSAHGLANQEVIKWIFELREQIGSDGPTKEQIEEYVKKTLSEGKVVPGIWSCRVTPDRPALLHRWNSVRSAYAGWSAGFKLYGIFMKQYRRFWKRLVRSRIHGRM